MTLPLDRIVPKLESPFWLWEEIEKLKCENAELKKQVDSLVANLAAAHEDRNEEAKSVFVAKQVEIPELLRENAALREQLKLETEKANARFDCAYKLYADKVALRGENAALKEALKEIATTAHCIALAGPLNTPTLQDAWGKFMKIDSMASAALVKKP